MTYQRVNPSHGKVFETDPGPTDARLEHAIATASANAHRWRRLRHVGDMDIQPFVDKKRGRIADSLAAA